MSIWFNLALATVLKTGFCILVIVRMLERHIDHQVHGKTPDTSEGRNRLQMEGGKGHSGNPTDHPHKASQAQQSMSMGGVPYQPVQPAVPSSGSVYRGGRR